MGTKFKTEYYAPIDDIIISNLNLYDKIIDKNIIDKNIIDRNRKQNIMDKYNEIIKMQNKLVIENPKGNYYTIGCDINIKNNKDNVLDEYNYIIETRNKEINELQKNKLDNLKKYIFNI